MKKLRKGGPRGPLTTCVQSIYMQECSVHSLIRLLFPWVQCIYTCKNIFYTGWYHFYSHGCEVFTCKNVLYTRSYVFYSHGCNVFIHARMFFTLADMILYPLRAPIFTVITKFGHVLIEPWSQIAWPW